MDNLANVTICFGCGCKVKSTEEFCSICKTKNPYFDPSKAVPQEEPKKEDVTPAAEPELKAPDATETAETAVETEAETSPSEETEFGISEDLIAKVKEFIIDGNEFDAVMLLCDELNMKSGEAKAKVAQIKESLPQDSIKKPEEEEETKPESANQPPKKSGEGITPASISVFAGNGNWADKKIAGGQFLANETSYVLFQVFFKNPDELSETTVHWEIFSSDGTSYTGPQESSFALDPDDVYIVDGWGWDEKGNWDIGKYYILANFDNSTPIRVDFEITGGSYGGDNINVKKLKLFAAGESITNADGYPDSRVFSRDKLSRLYFNLIFRPLRCYTYAPINYKIIGPDGNVFANLGVPIRLNPNYSQCWVNYGYPETNTWQCGTYKYEVSFGNSGKLTGTFVVK